MINWTKASSWCRKRKRKKYPLLPHKTTQGLGVADFDGWGLVENVISLVFARFFTLLFSFHFPEWGFRSHITLGTRGCFSRATGSFVLSAEGRIHERRSFSRGSLFKTDWNRKPRMKSLWHPPRVFTHKKDDNFRRDTDGCLHYTGYLWRRYGNHTGYGFCVHITTVISVWFL